MKVTVFSIAALFAVTAAADSPIDALPTCVKDCLKPYFQKGGEVAGCPQLDFKCVCKNNDFLGKIACCAKDNCDEASKNAILTFAQPLCKGYGIDVPNNIDAACKASKGDSTSSAASPSTASPSTAASSSAAPAATKKSDASLNSASGIFGAVAAALMAL